MNKVKEQKGRYYIESNVVLLDNVRTSLNGGLLWINIDGEMKISRPNAICPGPQVFKHIYFIANQDLKEGDWIIYNIHCSNTLNDFDTINENAIVTRYNTAVHPNKRYCKKIIATTDELCTGMTKGNVYYTFLPRPSSEFVKAFVEEFNSKNLIEKVWIELVYNITNEDWSKNPVQLEGNLELKVNQGNEITIKKIKDNYTKEEIVNIVKEMSQQGFTTWADRFRWLLETL